MDNAITGFALKSGKVRRAHRPLALLAVLGLFLVSSHNAVASGYGMAGCGLGSLIFKDQRGPVQILSATTNDFYWNQTSAMSSGTSNCNESAGTDVALYIEINRPQLAKDMARGEGETLAGLLKVMGCSNQDSLSSVLQNNYGEIFSPDHKLSTDVSKSINATIHREHLANSCRALG